MLGSVFHYAVLEPHLDHAFCEGQKDGVIAMHERMGYKWGGAYNGHFCWHGIRWRSYWGPNQATGDTWANLNLDAWCYLGTTDTPVTNMAAQAAYDCTLDEPQGRDQIYPHSAFFPTQCCGDPLREWIAAGALPPRQEETMLYQAESPALGVNPGSVWVDGGDQMREVFNLPPGAYLLPVPGQVIGDMNAHKLAVQAAAGKTLNGQLAAEVAAAVVAALPPAGGGGGPTLGQIEQAVTNVINNTNLAVG